MPKGIYNRKKKANRASKRKSPKRVTRIEQTARAIKAARQRFDEPIVIRAMPVLRTENGVAIDANSVDDRLSEVERVLRAISDSASQTDVLIHSAALRSVEILHKLRNELYSALSREKENV